MLRKITFLLEVLELRCAALLERDPVQEVRLAGERGRGGAVRENDRALAVLKRDEAEPANPSELVGHIRVAILVKMLTRAWSLLTPVMVSVSLRPNSISSAARRLTSAGTPPLGGCYCSIKPRAMASVIGRIR